MGAENCCARQGTDVLDKRMKTMKRKPIKPEIYMVHSDENQATIETMFTGANTDSNDNETIEESHLVVVHAD